MSGSPAISSVDRRQRGQLAEQHAAAHLLERGLVELDHNVGYRFGEVDLVMQHDGIIVFVEVRFRAQSSFGGAALSVNRVKQKRVAQAASAWLAAHPKLRRHACRFDVVALAGDPQAPSIQWIPNAFTLDDLA